MRLTTIASLATAVALTACMGAQRASVVSPAKVAGLPPSVQDKEAGLVTVAPGFDIRAYQTIVVDRFTVADSEIHDDEDRLLAASMPPFFQSELVRRLREANLFASVVSVADPAPPALGKPALRLEGNITRLAPGSQVARYFVGSGVGRSKVQVESRFIDAETGRIVVATADRREGSVGWAGGENAEFVRESFDDIARDLVRFLSRIAGGQVQMPRP